MARLQEDAGLSFIEYHALARLSENPGDTMRMSELAEVTNASLSRLSHLIKRLELRQLVRREPDPNDGRYTNAILTRTGRRFLTASAPAHVAKVRELVIDALSRLSCVSSVPRPSESSGESNPAPDSRPAAAVRVMPVRVRPAQGSTPGTAGATIEL